MRTASDTSVSIYPQYVVSYPLSSTSVNSLVYIVLTLHSDLCNRYCVPWAKQFDPIEALCKSLAPYNQGALRVPRGVQPLLAGICKLVTNEAGDDPPVSGTGTQLFRDTGGSEIRGSLACHREEGRRGGRGAPKRNRSQGRQLDCAQICVRTLAPDTGVKGAGRPAGITSTKAGIPPFLPHSCWTPPMY